MLTWDIEEKHISTLMDEWRETYPKQVTVITFYEGGFCADHFIDGEFCGASQFRYAEETDEELKGYWGLE